MMSESFGQAVFKLAYQLSPIILTNGIASSVGGALPIITLTEAANFGRSLLQGQLDINTDEYFANWQPMPGATLVDQEVAMYPFANQAVAANAVISNPLSISMLMTCPVRGLFGYTSKSITMQGLKLALDQHNSTGGTYTILTPSFIYFNCLMRSMRDVSSGDTKQTQVAWQFDFIKPLLTEEDPLGALSNLMGQMTNGTQINGQPATSGLPVSQTAPGGVSVPNSAYNTSATQNTVMA